jgi:NTE family protein
VAVIAKKTAFVLSGAGNRGPLEVGALRALAEAGLQPDLIVGTSAGAINGAYVACHGVSPETVDTMADLWRSVDTKAIYPGNVAAIAWRLVQGADSLFSSAGMRRIIEDNLPAGVTTFEDLLIPLFVTAVDLISARLFLFGDEGRASLIDAVVASASVPGIHPPVLYQGLQLVDGGVLANVPASIAMERGATEIYAINAGYGGARTGPVRGIQEVLEQTINTMISQSLLLDLEQAAANEDVNLHYIHVTAFEDLSFHDFSRSEEMIAVGYETAKAYLAEPRPRWVRPQLSPAWPGITVDGAREYVPPHLRRERHVPPRYTGPHDR